MITLAQINLSESDHTCEVFAMKQLHRRWVGRGQGDYQVGVGQRATH